MGKVSKFIDNNLKPCVNSKVHKILSEKLNRPSQENHNYQVTSFFRTSILFLDFWEKTIILNNTNLTVL